MASETFEIKEQPEPNEQAVSKGYYLSKTVCYTLIAVIGLTVIGLIVGLIVSNTGSSSQNDSSSTSSQQIADSCKELTCENAAPVLSGKFFFI